MAESKGLSGQPWICPLDCMPLRAQETGGGKNSPCLIVETRHQCIKLLRSSAMGKNHLEMRKRNRIKKFDRSWEMKATSPPSSSKIARHRMVWASSKPWLGTPPKVLGVIYEETQGRKHLTKCFAPMHQQTVTKLRGLKSPDGFGSKLMRASFQRVGTKLVKKQIPQLCKSRPPSIGKQKQTVTCPVVWPSSLPDDCPSNTL